MTFIRFFVSMLCAIAMAGMFSGCKDGEPPSFNFKDIDSLGDGQARVESSRFKSYVQKISSGSINWQTVYADPSAEKTKLTLQVDRSQTLREGSRALVAVLLSEEIQDFSEKREHSSFHLYEVNCKTRETAGRVQVSFETAFGGGGVTHFMTMSPVWMPENSGGVIGPKVLAEAC